MIMVRFLRNKKAVERRHRHGPNKKAMGGAFRTAHGLFCLIWFSLPPPKRQADLWAE
jgi:hypothetical protein